MVDPIDTAIRVLESHGLRVVVNHPEKITVTATAIDTPLGLSISGDATHLCRQQDRWTAIFPGPGQCTYEIPGTLEKLTDLILAVYGDFECHKGRLHESFDRVVAEPKRFLHGSYTMRDVTQASAS